MARVAVDVELAHLDRPFDYLVPEPLAARGPARRPGAGAVRRPAGRRVRRRAGRPTASTPAGWPSCDRVVSPEPVLTPEVAAARPRGRRPVRRHAGRRAAAGRAARGTPGSRPRRRSRATEPEPRGTARARSPPAGPATTPAPPCSTPCTPAPRSGRVWSALPGPTWPDELARLVADRAGRRPGRPGRAAGPPRRRPGRRRADRAGRAPTSTSS